MSDLERGRTDIHKLCIILDGGANRGNGLFFLYGEKGAFDLKGLFSDAFVSRHLGLHATLLLSQEELLKMVEISELFLWFCSRVFFPPFLVRLPSICWRFVEKISPIKHDYLKSQLNF